MGKKDVAAKDYLEKNEYFADLFNVVIYHGKQVVSPDELEEADTTELSLPYGNNALEPVQKYRDILKVSRRGKRAVYSLYGIEVQDQVHYAGPVKSALYDVLNLAKQVQNAANSYRKMDEDKDKDAIISVEDDKIVIKLSSAEFLSGFRAEDRLIPVVTVFLFLSGEPWDGPRCISDMYRDCDRETLEAAIDCKMNLVVPAEIPDEDFKLFRTDLGAALKFFKCSDKKQRLNIPLNFNKIMVDVPTGMFLHECFNLKLTEVEKKGGSKMCKLIEGYREDCKILGALEAYLDMGLSREVAMQTVCDKHHISKEELEQMIADDLEYPENA